MLPEGWNRINLGKLAKISSGSTPSRGVADYWGGSIPWATTGEINYADILDTREKITDKALAATSLKVHLPGTILLAMIGQGATRGRVARLKISATTNQNCCAIVSGKEVCSDYLYFYLEDQYQEIRDLSNAGGQQSLNADLIRNIMVHLPPLPEQRKIADILGTWDRAIALTARLIAAKGQRKRGLMQQLLSGKRRFPGFAGTPWSTRKAGELFQPYSKRNNGDEELLSVTQEHGVIPRSMLEARVTMPAGETQSYKLIEPGDFIISLRSFQVGIEYSEYRGIVSPAYTVRTYAVERGCSSGA